MDSKVIKNTKFNTLKRKVNNSDEKILDATTLININQYNTDKHDLEKKLKILKKISKIGGLVTTTVTNTKISEVENKIPDTCSLVTTDVLNTKIAEVEDKIPNNNTYISQEFNKFTTENFKERLKQADLISWDHFDNKLISFNKKNYLK